MKELSDLKNWIEEIEQQSYTYDGRAYERCEYALFETLERNTLICAYREDDASREMIGFFKDEKTLRNYLSKSYYLY